jgi:hypothetical protein
VILTKKHFVLETIPPSGPILIGPIDHEAQVKRPVSNPTFDGAIHDWPPIKPVIVEAKGINFMILSQLDLLLEDLIRITEVVVANFGGYLRLTMKLE